MSNTSDLSKVRSGTMIASRYRISHKLGEGGFGKVYSATDSRGRSYAVKFEKHRWGDELRYEKYIYERINSDGEAIGIPRLHYYGRHRGHAVMVLDLLGKCLESRISEQGGRLSLKSCYMVGLQMLTRLETLHERGFVHSDIKPDNVLTGRSHTKRLYLADFGLCRKFRKSDGEHVGYSESGMGGTVTYSSRHVMKGVRCTRRDDLESLGYLLIDCYRGLPWHSVKGSRRKETVLRMKERLDTRVMDGFGGLKDYMEYVRKLRFADRPSYRSLRGYLEKGLRRKGLVDDGKFDWI